MSEFPSLKQIIEGAILAADRPLSIDQMIQLFEGEQPSRALIREALSEIESDCEGRGFELKEVASGYRFQVRTEYSEWVARLWEEKPPRYSRALLETLALIAYKQPITRGDIEEVRGVSVSTNIIRSLLEREWIRIVGHRDVPGRPAIYATTRAFLDYFNLSSLDELPTLSEIKDLDKMNPELELEDEMPEARSIELEVAGKEPPAEDDEFDLDEVTNQVNRIHDNIRSLFAGEEEYDEEEDPADGDDPGTAAAESEGDDPGTGPAAESEGEDPGTGPAAESEGDEPEAAGPDDRPNEGDAEPDQEDSGGGPEAQRPW